MDRQKSLAAGGDDFLTKPVQTDELFQVLAQHLELVWTYELVETPAIVIPLVDLATASDTHQEAEWVSPPIEELEKLLVLAQQGRLKKLIEEAKILESSNVEYTPLIQQLIQLARSFQAEKIEEALKQSIGMKRV
jgi:DNA-binding response OmpR family regulator